jgi:hypothetical protein
MPGYLSPAGRGVSGKEGGVSTELPGLRIRIRIRIIRIRIDKGCMV